MRMLIVIACAIVTTNIALSQVGNWPVSPNYLYFGANELGQSNQAMYCLLQDKSSGETFLNSSDKIHFRISNNEKMILTNSGNFGIGTATPSTKLSFGTSIQARTLSLYDDINDWYGLGMQSYQMRFQVGTANARFSFYAGDNTELMTIKGSGNVGIGTSTPSQTLNIYKPSSQTQFLIGNSNTVSGGYTSMAMGTSSDVNGYSFIQSIKSSGVAFGDIVLNQSGGNVGIGTTSPNQKLTVNGTIYGKEVKVDLNVPGPDYVFEKDYKLPSLEEIKLYIDRHKHLPEVPSAKDMEQNGINVSAMNMILLKKIEELTLHVIEQNKLINHLQEEQNPSPDLSGKKIEEMMLQMIELKKENQEIKSLLLKSNLTKNTQN
jgi:hypothetical protein